MESYLLNFDDELRDKKSIILTKQKSAILNLILKILYLIFVFTVKHYLTNKNIFFFIAGRKTLSASTNNMHRLSIFIGKPQSIKSKFHR